MLGREGGRTCRRLDACNNALTARSIPLTSRLHFALISAMPNTKSAAKQARSSERRAARNHSVKSRLKSLEKKYLALVAEGKVDEAKKAYSDVASAFDKASKSGVIKKEKAQRKRSRLQVRLNGAAKKKAA